MIKKRASSLSEHNRADISMIMPHVSRRYTLAGGFSNACSHRRSAFVLEGQKSPQPDGKIQKRIFFVGWFGPGGCPFRVDSQTIKKYCSASRHSLRREPLRKGVRWLSMTASSPGFEGLTNKTIGAGEHGLPARTGLPNAPSSSRFIIVSESIRVWVHWTGR